LAAAAFAALAWAGFTACFAMPSLSRKQQHGTFHTRSQLQKEVLEVPLPEEELEPPPSEQLPERRAPYTMHILSQYPDHHHLPDEGATQKFIVNKVQGALENTESLIKHVEVAVYVLEHFHKVKVNHKKPPQGGAVNLDEAASGEVGKVRAAKPPSDDGYRELAPYQVKVVISLKNRKEVVFANPEKHAQATITEAIDEACDGIRRLMREEKVKDIQKQRRQHEELGMEQQTLDETDDEMLVASEQEAMLADAAMDEMYKKVESTIDGVESEDAGAEAQEPPRAPPAPRAQEEAQSLRNLLL
jgi:hypothetical protein